jgi:histidyl-tRNA synthetase
MAEIKQIRAIKGVRDILHPASAAWNRVEQAAREVFATFGYGEIRLPIIEPIELFARAVGEETDIVNKEMFSFEEHGFTDLAGFRRAIINISPLLDDSTEFLLRNFEANVSRFLMLFKSAVERGEIARTPENLQALEGIPDHLAALKESLVNHKLHNPVLEAKSHWKAIQVFARGTHLGEQICLRPEATASVVRAYIEHGMHTLPGDVKLYYMGPMFRRERPQKGRYRQFYQIGAEVLGQSDAPGIDAELIEMLFAFFGRVGLDGLTLDLNSIGCKECRPKYVELLRAALRKVSSELGADSQRRIETNPLRVLDSKLPEEQAIIEKLPRISEHLCEACKAHFAEVRRQLDLRGIAYKLNWRLVRGLDYYMRTTFEITAPGLGSQNAVCGGGRYDGLIELLGGPPTKGIGFAIGEDRVMLSLEAAGKIAAEPTVDAFIVWMGATAQPAAIKLAQRLRAAGIKVEVPPQEFKFKKALGLADKLGARYAVLIGENEIAAGKFTLKRLKDALQTSLTEIELVSTIKGN